MMGVASEVLARAETMHGLGAKLVQHRNGWFIWRYENRHGDADVTRYMTLEGALAPFHPTSGLRWYKGCGQPDPGPLEGSK